MATHLNYWDYDREQAIACSRCGWTGTGGGHEELFDELLDVCCPKCELMLLIVAFPTGDETRAAAAAGNIEAKAALPSLDAREARLARAARLELEAAADLPDLEGSDIEIEWDFGEIDDEVWTILRHRGEEIWRELAYWEGYRRFAAVFAILQERYGSRLSAVQPTQASELYLYGDKLYAHDTIDQLNAGLKRS